MTSSSSTSQPYLPKSQIYPHPLLSPPKSKYDFLPPNYPFTPHDFSRASLESYHIRLQSHIFSSRPFPLTTTTLSHLRHHGPSVSAENAHRFCWKDDAVYITTDLGDAAGSTDVGVDWVFNYLYRTWVRDEEEGLDIGSFFGHAVRCWDEDGVKAVGELVSAHRVICGRVKERMAEGTGGFKEDKAREWNKGHEEFVVKKSFGTFFVIFDQGIWWERGVLLVRSERAQEVEGQEGRKDWPVFDEGDEGWAVRMGMNEVVDLVRCLEDAGKERA